MSSLASRADPESDEPAHDAERAGTSHALAAAQGVPQDEPSFRTLADAAPVMLWLANPDCARSWFNRGWLDFTGTRMEHERGAGWTEAVHPDDRARCLEVYGSAFEHRQPYQSEYRLRRHDGVYRWVHDRGVPHYASDGTFEGYVGSCFDVTERKEAEERLVASNAELGRVVEQRTAELRNLSRHLLRNIEEEKAHLARQLHDELGASLTAINIDLGLLKSKLKDTGPHLVPGLEQTVWFTPTLAGDYEVACSQLCGLAHFRMRAAVSVRPPADVEAFLAEELRNQVR